MAMQGRKAQAGVEGDGGVVVRPDMQSHGAVCAGGLVEQGLHESATNARAAVGFDNRDVDQTDFQRATVDVEGADRPAREGGDQVFGPRVVVPVGILASRELRVQKGGALRGRKAGGVEFIGPGLRVKFSEEIVVVPCGGAKGEVGQMSHVAVMGSLLATGNPQTSNSILVRIPDLQPKQKTKSY